MLLSDESHLKSEMGADMQLSDRIGRRLKLQDLHVLMTVVQAGTMGKAAQRLNTTQPNISRAIAELEHAFGVRLLDRHRQGIAPTEYGRALLDCGAAVFDDLRQGVKKIEFLADPGAGEVRIGSTTYTGEIFVTAVIERLSRRYPRMVFHLVTADETDTLYRELSERNVDFLIARKGGRFSDEKLGFEILYAPSLVVVAGSRSPWARRRRIALAELVNEPWVLPPPEDIMGPTLSGHLPRQRSRLSSHSGLRHSARSAAQSRGDRALSYDAHLGVEIFQAPGDHGLARQAATRARAGRNYHPEEPHAQPRRTAFHRRRPRSCEASGTKKMVDAMSGYGPPQHFVAAQLGSFRSEADVAAALAEDTSPLSQLDHVVAVAGPLDEAQDVARDGRHDLGLRFR